MDPRRSLTIIVVFLAGVVVAWFFLAEGFLMLQGTPSPEPSNEIVGNLPFVLVNSKREENHVYTGSLEMPTPCHTLSSSLTTSGGAARNVHISLTVVAPPEGVLCAQVVDTQDFSVSLTSKEIPTVTLEINGEETPVSVVEG